MASTLTPEKIEEVVERVATETRVRLTQIMDGEYQGCCGSVSNDHIPVSLRIDYSTEDLIA